MKKYLSIIVMLSLFLIGCSEETSLNSPVENLSKNKPNYISLPSVKGVQVNSDWIVSKKINGAKGGSLSNYISYRGGIFGTVTIDAEILFENGSYPGNETITMELSDQNTSVQFGPSMSFNRTVLYNVTYTGLDLTGINPSTVKFVYIADDGSLEVAACDAIIVDASKGKLQVVNAVIPHFSRYGFVI